MTAQEALAITTGLATFFDRRAWTAEKIRFFAQAIEDLPYETASEAARRYMRDGEYAPVPRDIREIARTIVPESKRLALPHPESEPPKIYQKPGDGTFQCTPQERRDLDRTYARMRAETIVALRKQRERDGKRNAPMREELQRAIDRLSKHEDDECPF